MISEVFLLDEVTEDTILHGGKRDFLELSMELNHNFEPVSEIELDLKNGVVCSDVVDKFSERKKFKKCSGTKNKVSLVIVYFNPFSCEFQKRACLQCIEMLGELKDHLRVYELIFDDQKKDIPQSIEIRGSIEKNLLWQKESLLDIALQESDDD